MKRLILVLFVLLMTGFSASQGQAQNAGKFCEGIKTTANLVGCLNTYYEKKKLELAVAFDEILLSLSDDDADLFKETQQKWVSYRDTECEWEAHSEEKESLKRVKELYCLVRLSEKRQQILHLSRSDLESQNVYQGITPRWENVLNDSYGDIYWKANSRIKGDFNCDGQEENFILGIKNDTSNRKAGFFVVGLIENPSIGQPSARIFDLPLTRKPDETNSEERVCNDIAQIVLQQSLTEDTCEPSRVVVVTESCGEFALIYGQDGFDFLPIDVNRSDEGKMN